MLLSSALRGIGTGETRLPLDGLKVFRRSFWKGLGRNAEDVFLFSCLLVSFLGFEFVRGLFAVEKRRVRKSAVEMGSRQ
jgi:hypothetical protein